MAFRFWNDGTASGAYHMAVDRVLLRRMELGLSLPYLRVYSWKPACLTLGYSQSHEKELDAEAMARAGWTWAKRPTGGRAVLHGHEFTYSMAAPFSFSTWCQSRDRSYAVIAQSLQRMLQLAGIQTQLARGDSVDAQKQAGPSRPCFASTSKLEVTLNGKKLIGSAQRRLRNCFLQHGSMPLDPSFLDLVQVLPLSDAEKAVYLQDMAAHATSLAEYQLGFESFVHHAKQAFSEILHLEWLPMGLTEEEKLAIEAEMQSNPFGLRPSEVLKADFV
jgi:lipoyl(octanoyl) transferase